jgi:hypothetical protein
VDNKELNPVLEQIVAETPKHPCFVKDCGKKAEGWFQYEFHLKDDPSYSKQDLPVHYHLLAVVQLRGDERGLRPAP